VTALAPERASSAATPLSVATGHLVMAAPADLSTHTGSVGRHRANSSHFACHSVRQSGELTRLRKDLVVDNNGVGSQKPNERFWMNTESDLRNI